MADEMQTTIYQAICTSYHAINDWRAKLLGFLPLASGAGIFFLLNSSFTTVTTQGKSTTITTPLTQYLLPIGIVGALVTLGLFIYDVRAIQLRIALVEAGKAIEDSKPSKPGQFKTDLIVIAIFSTIR
jgi:predicted membrane channel-forming protein YqfA (hemolysin III family)